MHRLTTVIRRTLSSYPKIKMNTKLPNIAVVKHIPGDSRFTFSFHLNTGEPLKINRQFNMCREVEESMGQFTERLVANLEKTINKKNKKQKVDHTTSTKLMVEFVQKGSTIEGEKKVKDVLFTPGIVVKIASQEFRVKVNPPLVENAKLADTLMAGFPTYPFKLNLVFANQTDSVFEWYVSSTNKEWTKRSTGFFFTPSNQDVHRHVKMICRPFLGPQEGLSFEVISKNPVSAGPGHCPFEQRATGTTGSNELRVVTYNLLADVYADSDYSRTVLHPQCPAYALAIDYRRSLFIKELLGYNADLMCLQEVDHKVFDADLMPVLSSRGFDGVFDRKGGQVSEGLACFWNTDKLNMVATQRMVLGQAIKTDERFADLYKVVQDNDQFCDSFVNRTTTIQTVVLDSKVDSSKGLVVGTTHLYFKPDADHIRLLQAAMCLRELEHVLEKQQQSSSNTRKYSVMLCGDFNSTPPFGVLEFVRKGQVGPDHADWSSTEGEHVKGLAIKHPFNMDSACGTPKYTTYTITFKDCLDYIFYDTDTMKVTNVVPFPLEEELQVHQGLPNVVYPSDHIACIADLKWA